MAAGRAFIPWFFILLMLFPLLIFPQIQNIERSAKVVVIEGKEYYLHKILKGQTLYSISKTYNVALDSLYKINPEIAEGAKAGQEIRVPLVRPGDEQKVKEKIKTTTNDRVVITPIKSDTLHTGKEMPLCDSSKKTTTFQVALMLPLYLDEVDSIKIFHREGEVLTPDRFNSFRFIQFYEGFMMAIDSLKTTGMNLKIHVYDMNDDTVEVRRILKKSELKDMDLIVGLLYGSVFSMVSKFAQSHNISIVNPLSNKYDYIAGKPNVFLANPTVKTMNSEMVDFFLNRFGGQEIFLLSSDKSNEKRTFASLREAFDARKTTADSLEPLYHYLGNVNEGAEKLGEQMSRVKDNLVIFLSNDELQVANLIRRIIRFTSSHSIILFGSPSWMELNGIESQDLVKLKYHSYSPSFLDYGREDVKKFVKGYRNTYKTEPQEYAFQGYDIGCYFLSALFRYGKDFCNCLPFMKSIPLQKKYLFQRLGNDGFENHYLNIFWLDDFQIKNAREFSTF